MSERFLILFGLFSIVVVPTCVVIWSILDTRAYFRKINGGK